MISPLMQPKYDSTHRMQGNPDLHNHRTILVEIMRGFNTNVYIAFYFNEKPVIGFIADKYEEFSYCASTACHKKTDIRYMINSSASSTRTIPMTPYSLRIGEEMLASMIFLVRHRVASTIAPYR
uniref:Uncharacterized protein n=1 Tax=Guillardia theta TaxID=55529 RepID=A0A7S4NYU9_GUITH|mmetsp:Transcript_37930/g.119749  ORF Transcript_37930/g.119749 Transcript_37930/m.119749 type:complete len:124 (+) Transcript_37930:138-509(+)